MRLAERVRNAHADAWAAEGGLREPLGGAALSLRDIRVMASGLPAAGAEVTGLAVRAAGPADLETVLDLDSAAFGGDRDASRPWIRSHLDAPAFTVALAEVEGQPAATAYSALTDGAAGPCLVLAGVAVAEPLRRRGIGAAVSSWLLARGFAAGARLAHLHAETDAAARVYARLGFTDAGVLRVFADV